MLTLICGLTRAGKTTYSERYDKEIVIHLDKTRNFYKGVEKAVKERTGDIVVDGVFSKKFRRLGLLNAYQGDGPKKCIWLDTPDEIRMNRPGFIKYCDNEFEPPTYDEGWDEIEIIRDV